MRQRQCRQRSGRLKRSGDSGEGGSPAKRPMLDKDRVGHLEKDAEQNDNPIVKEDHHANNSINSIKLESVLFIFNY